MKHDVAQIPTYEEFFGLYDNELSDDEFTVKEEDEKIKEIITLALLLLQDFYLQVQYYNAYDILSERFEEELNSFSEELKDSLLILFNKYLEELQAEQNLEYNIPSNVVQTTVEFETVLDKSVDTVTKTLQSELEEKAQFYRDMAVTTGMFSLHSNFRRAVKNLGNKISNNAHHAKKVVERDYLTFVYGQEALFYWRCSGINTCAWCYEIEAMGAMPLSWFPVDHINGRCTLVPVKPDEFSEEYNNLIR